MSAERDRIERAGRYVLGQMDAGERDRAERDLEFDAKFRAAVVAVAERMHLFDVRPNPPSPPDWGAVAGSLAGLPHMGSAVAQALPQGEHTPQRHGPTSVGSGPSPLAQARRSTITRLVLASAIALAFGAGYVTALLTILP